VTRPMTLCLVLIVAKSDVAKTSSHSFTPSRNFHSGIK
jgi:hypothetical protein